MQCNNNSNNNNYRQQLLEACDDTVFGPQCRLQASQQVLLAKKGKQERGGKRETETEKKERMKEREAAGEQQEQSREQVKWLRMSLKCPNTKSTFQHLAQFPQWSLKALLLPPITPPPLLTHYLAINYFLCLCCWPQLCDPKHNESLITRQLRLSLAPQTPIASQVPWTPSPVAAMSAQLCDTIAAFNCSTGFVLHKEECRGGRGEGEECWRKSEEWRGKSEDWRVSA